MAENYDNTGLFGLFQSGLDISLGAAHKGIEMARNPPEAASKLLSDVSGMFTVPPNTGPDVQDKVQALAGLWMQKGMALLAECKVAGEKYKNAGDSPKASEER